MRYTLLLFITLTFVSCSRKANNNDLADRKEKIEEAEGSAPTQGQIDRKTKSIEYCKSKGIPTIENLPYTEDAKIRPKEDVIGRALALCYLGLKSEGAEQKHLDGFEKKYQVAQYFTEAEKLYVNASTPTEQQTTDANWRYESLHVLLWSLGYLDDLSFPNEMCNVGEDVKIIFRKTKDEFIAGAKLRSKEEILDQADLIYRIHWACVDSRIKNQDAPSGLNPSIVYERHYALNWLIHYMDQDWDDVSTDT